MSRQPFGKAFDLYAGKKLQEELVTASPAGWTILRAAQRQHEEEEARDRSSAAGIRGFKCFNNERSAASVIVNLGLLGGSFATSDI